MAETFSEVILRYKIDKASLTQAVAANNTLKASLDTVADIGSTSNTQLKQTFTSSSQSASVLATRIREAEARGQRLATVMDEVSRRTKTAADVEFDNLRGVVGGGASAGGNSQIGTTNDAAFQRANALRNTKSLLGDLPGGAELAGLADIAGDINSAGQAALQAGVSVRSLATAGGLGIVAIAGLSLAIGEFNRITEEARAAFNAAQNAQRSYYDLLADGSTSEEARAHLEELRRAEQFRAQEAAQDQALLDSAFQQLVASNGEATARIIFASGAFNDLQTAADESAAALQANQTEQQFLVRGLEEGAFATNDAAAAQQELAASTQLATDAILGSITERVNREVEYSRLAASASSDSIQAQIDANNVRVEALNRELESLALMAANGADVTEAVSNLNREITDLERDTQRLSGSIIESARAREQEVEAARASEQAARERAQTLSQVANLERQLRDQTANERRADARAERDFNRQRLREDLDFQAQLAQQEAEFNQSQLDAIKEAQEADKEARSERLETEKDYSEREIERVKAFNERIADINRRASDEIGDAAGELDAKRVDAALRAKQTELADAVKENDKQAQENAKSRDERLQQIEQERKERQSELAQRLADERANFQAQRQQQIADFNQRRQRENEDRAIRRNDELQDRQIRRQALLAQINDLKESLEQEKQIRRQGYAAMLADARNAFGQLGGGGKGNIGAGSSNGFGSPPPNSGGGSFGSGSKPPIGGGLVSGFNGGGGASGFNGGFSNPAVLSNNNQQNNNTTFYISSNDPNQVAAAVRQTMAQVLAKK